VLALSVLAVSGCVTRPRSSSSPVPNRFDSAKVETAPFTNINTAATQELERLPGVGPAIAERIVAHREQYGPFRRAEHLMMVRGISDHKFRQMRTLIVAE
jgi:competence ComEA-like helix-hairpin-helix protein